jgi:hypothetical protein
MTTVSLAMVVTQWHNYTPESEAPRWKSLKRIAKREVKFTRMVKQAKLQQE